MSGRILAFITIIAVFLLIVISYLLIKTAKPKVKEDVSSIITPSLSQSKTTDFIPSPTLIKPTFTGAREVTLPAEEKNLVEQKQSLRRKTPIKTDQFIIDFDYESDFFIVTLSAPKDTSRQAFKDWLKNNYPAISIDRFNFN